MPGPRRVLSIGWWAWVCLLAPAGVPAQAGAGPRHDPDVPAVSVDRTRMLDAYVSFAVMTLDPRPQAVLRTIPNRARRMLAVAHYLHRRDQVDTLWTWTARQARAHQHTARYRRAMTDLLRVKRTFARLNPGYVLVADTSARSLRVQVAYWNRERSVAAAAQELQDSCLVWLSDDSNAGLSDSARRTRFIDRLATYTPARLPTVAVPGLSLHGQIRAVDFAILRGGRLVAGTRSATADSVWNRGGWTERLKLAVTAAAAGLDGPLETPPEPWHYEYRLATH